MGLLNETAFNPSEGQKALLDVWPKPEALSVNLDSPALVHEACTSGKGSGDPVFDLLWVRMAKVDDFMSAQQEIETLTARIADVGERLASRMAPDAGPGGR